MKNIKHEIIRSNAEVHGVAHAARVAKKKGINIDDVFMALFGRYSGVKKG